MSADRTMPGSPATSRPRIRVITRVVVPVAILGSATILIVASAWREPVDVFDHHLYEKGALVLHTLRTLLGSCVAITLWHPTRRIGGMCHFLLPERKRRTNEPPDGRYGDEAVAEMVKVLSALRWAAESSDQSASRLGRATP
jgi:hypothetical protein